MSMAESDLSIDDASATARRMAAERRACGGVATERLEQLSVRELIAAAEAVQQALTRRAAAAAHGGDSEMAGYFTRLACTLSRGLWTTLPKGDDER